MWAKYHKNDIKSGIYPSEKHEIYFPCPETQNKIVFRVELMVCGLDHSGSQPFIRESVDSLCRDDADMPMPPYIRKAYNRPNAAFVSLFR